MTKINSIDVNKEYLGNIRMACSSYEQENEFNSPEDYAKHQEAPKELHYDNTQQDISQGTQQDELRGKPSDFSQETVHEVIPQLAPHAEEPKDIFSLLEGTNIANENTYGRCEVVWNEKHLQVEPGLNILATCKNVDCPCYFNGIICPRGLFQARKGYCSFDREIHEVKCPICKQRIAADTSFGIGFYRCKVKLEFKLTGSAECHKTFEAVNDTFVMTKCSSSSSGPFLYLEIRMRF